MPESRNERLGILFILTTHLTISARITFIFLIFHTTKYLFVQHKCNTILEKIHFIFTVSKIQQNIFSIYPSSNRFYRIPTKVTNVYCLQGIIRRRCRRSSSGCFSSFSTNRRKCIHRKNLGMVVQSYPKPDYRLLAQKTSPLITQIKDFLNIIISKFSYL